MTDHDAHIDWQALAEDIGVDPNSGGDRIARRAVSALLGDEALSNAVDWYIDGRPAFEPARSVLRLLRPEAARARCLAIYRTNPERQRRRLAVELLRVVATAEELPPVTEFLADTDPAIQTWGIGVLDQLLFSGQIDQSQAEPYLRTAAQHRERHDFLREHLGAGERRPT